MKKVRRKVLRQAVAGRQRCAAEVCALHHDGVLEPQVIQIYIYIVMMNIRMYISRHNIPYDNLYDLYSYRAV